jgi:hypothetical protein
VLSAGLLGAGAQIFTTELQAAARGGEPCPWEQCVVHSPPKNDQCEPEFIEASGCCYIIETCVTEGCYECGPFEYCWDPPGFCALP